MTFECTPCQYNEARLVVGGGAPTRTRPHIYFYSCCVSRRHLCWRVLCEMNHDF